MELNFEPGLCHFSKSDKEPIDFGPVSGVEIVGIFFKHRRVGVGDDDFAEFGADQGAQDVQLEKIWLFEVFGKIF